MPISKSRSAILGGTNGATSLAEEKQWSSELEADVAAVDAKVKAIYETRADFLSDTVANIQGRYGSTGTIVANVRETGASYTIDLSQAASFDFTTSGGVEVTMIAGSKGAVSSEQIEAPANFTAARFGQLLSEVRPIEFGAGEFPIESTVTFPVSPAFGGGHITGAGKAVSDRSIGRSRNSESRIAWVGTSGGTMLRVPGSAGLTYSHIALSGISANGATNNAAVGIQIAADSGVGSGVSSFASMSFHDFDVAIRCGEAQGDANCADLDFERITAQACGTFLQVENDQGVNYNFRFCSANFSDRFVHCKRGGNVSLDVGNFAGVGSTNWIFEMDALGDSTYANEITNIRLEQNSKRLWKSTGGFVSISNITEAQSNQSVRMFEFNGTNAKVSGSRLVTHDATNPTFHISNQTGGFRGSLSLSDVYFDTATWNPLEWFDIDNNNPPPVITMSRCSYGVSSTTIPDFSTDTAFGNVFVQGVTSGASAATLTQFGLTRAHNSVIKTRPNTIQTFEVSIVGVNATGSVAARARRLCTTKNDAGACTLVQSETIGTDYNPLTLSTLPSFSVSDGFDCLDVTVTGKSSETIDWQAMVREVACIEI